MHIKKKRERESTLARRREGRKKRHIKGMLNRRCDFQLLTQSTHEGAIEQLWALALGKQKNGEGVGLTSAPTPS